MGIRFYCPNGHKLNVKLELAGKRAICPDCGAKLVVPAAATMTSESAIHEGGGKKRAERNEAVTPAGTRAADASAPTIFERKTTATVLQHDLGQEPSSRPNTPQPPVIWYIRPATG